MPTPTEIHQLSKHVHDLLSDVSIPTRVSAVCAVLADLMLVSDSRAKLDVIDEHVHDVLDAVSKIYDSEEHQDLLRDSKLEYARMTN
jgi:hypothetical protein